MGDVIRDQYRHLVVSGGGLSVSRHGGGDVTAPCAEPHGCRLVRDALSDLVRSGVSGMGPNPVGRQGLRVSEEPARQCAPASAWKSSREEAGARMNRSPST